MPSNSALKISRILHAGYIFECAETQIAFDPIFENPFSRNCYAYPDVQFHHEQIRQLKFAAVFISHHHDDHCSLESLDLLNRETPLYIYCLHEEIFNWVRELGFHKVTALKLNSPVEVGGFVVTPLRALDPDVDSIFHIQAAGLNILNVVDSWVDPDTMTQLEREKTWDVVLWPFQTMRELEVLSPSRATAAPRHLPLEWVEQIKALKPRFVVPSSCQFIHESWSWYRHAYFPITYAQFFKEIEDALPSTRVLRLDPSLSIAISREHISPSPPLPWLVLQGEPNVSDYAYDATKTPPTTAEIARHFGPLNRVQKNHVDEFCRIELLERYRNLETSGEDYFAQPRVWRLALFDHEGGAQNYHYRLHGADIEELSELDKGEPLAWLTEVPRAKLYAALEAGESLSSMYMRINDQKLSAQVESDLAGVDILEDPLVRCLFTGRFGEYQKAQLKTIMAKALS